MARRVENVEWKVEIGDWSVFAVCSGYCVVHDALNLCKIHAACLHSARGLPCGCCILLLHDFIWKCGCIVIVFVTHRKSLMASRVALHVGISWPETGLHHAITCDGMPHEIFHEDGLVHSCYIS